MTEQEIIAGTYDGVMDVIGRQYNEAGGIQREQPVTLYRQVPCAVSRSRAGARNGNQPVSQGLAAALQYETKVFTSPQWEIPAGCCLLVTRQGKTVRYITCGEPVRYLSHQELLVVREDYA